MSETRPAFNGSWLLSRIWQLLVLMIIDGFALSFIYTTFAINGNVYIAALIALITIGVNVVFLSEKLYPFRWFSPGLALMFLLVVYPVVFTTYVAFTNYRTGHILSKEQAISRLEKETYLPEEGSAFRWTAFRSDDESTYLLWLQADGRDALLAAAGEFLALGSVNAGPLDGDGIPESILGYDRLARGQTLSLLNELSQISFGDAENAVFVQTLDAAAQVRPKYQYDVAQDALVDLEMGVVCNAADDGYFRCADAEEPIEPGFIVWDGWNNFNRLFTSSAFRGPFLSIFVWTFLFAILIVFITFAAGLILAIIFNDPTLPGRKIIQSAMVIPYAVPAFISVQMWRGLLTPEFGIVSKFLNDLVGWSPPWFSDPTWVKVGILFVGLWLGFPYMFLICTGALQAIPSDVYEAAEVDGANGWQRFWNITFPLLMVAVGPLLIGSFAFNFNNFTIIDVFNQGGPPFPNSPIPAGQSDILISYIFRLATSRGVDYGLASAITIIIFLILATVVAIQFRYTRVWEEVSENV